MSKRNNNKNLLKIFEPIFLAIVLCLATACTPTPTPTVEPIESIETTVGSTAQSIDDTLSTKEDAEPELSELNVYYMDMEQGDATLITCGNEAMLIDSGENDKGTEIQLFLKKNGVDKLKYMIGTHLDSDHIGGMDVILTKFDCETIMLPEAEKDTAVYDDVISAMNYKKYKNTAPVVGDTYQLGDAEFTIISPNADYEDDHNNWSIGLVLRHGVNEFLFTGDAEKKGELDILKNSLDISCNVYKVGHHGSNTSTTDELLDAANPEFAVISCGENNSYGHPDMEILDKLKAKGIKVFRTDEQDTIIATSDGESIVWNCPPSETWKAGDAIEPSKLITETETNSTYVLNTGSKKFHYITCNGLPTKNREDTQMSKEDIIAKGYQPCKRCNP